MAAGAKVLGGTARLSLLELLQNEPSNRHLTCWTIQQEPKLRRLILRCAQEQK